MFGADQHLNFPGLWLVHKDSGPESPEFQNEASDVIVGNPTAVHLNLRADPVGISLCSCFPVEVCSADWWPGHAISSATPRNNKYGRHSGLGYINGLTISDQGL